MAIQLKYDGFHSPNSTMLRKVFKQTTKHGKRKTKPFRSLNLKDKESAPGYVFCFKPDYSELGMTRRIHANTLHHNNEEVLEDELPFSPPSSPPSSHSYSEGTSSKMTKSSTISAPPSPPSSPPSFHSEDLNPQKFISLILSCTEERNSLLNSLSSAEEDSDQKSSQPTTTIKHRIPKSQNHVLKCFACETTKSPYWREGWNSQTLCNACGVRFRKYQTYCPSCKYIPAKRELSSKCTKCNTPTISLH